MSKLSKLGNHFENSVLREYFEAERRCKEYIANISVFITKSKNPELIEIKQALET